MTVGRIVEYKICDTERQLKMSKENSLKRQERQELRAILELHPMITEHEKQFSEHLLKCPFCGKAPRYGKIAACDNPSGYDYKLRCDLHDGYGSPFLTCGDWFDTPAKAGRDWNERVRKAKMNKQEREAYWTLGKHRSELTRQQFRTLKGQIFAGDAKGAMCGLKRMMKERTKHEAANNGHPAK